MMGIGDIISLSREQAVRACAYELEPYSPYNADEFKHWAKRIPITNLGDYRPDGWKLIDYVDVDKTGFGKSWEPALTIPAFIEWASEKFAADDQAGFAIIEESQFQLVVGYFTTNDEINPTEEATSARGISCSDLEIDYCPNCDWPFEADSDKVYCNNCGCRMDGPVYNDGDRVTVAEPGYGDDWPAGVIWTVVGDFYADDGTATLATPDGEEWEFEPEYIKSLYNPADDPNQLVLL